MLSLTFISLLLALNLVAGAWVMTLAARWVGSTRDRFAVALAAALMIFVLRIAMVAIVSLLPYSRAETAIVVSVLLLVLELAVTFKIIRSAFAVSSKHALAPFFGLLAVGIGGMLFVVFITKPLVMEALVVPTAGMAPTLEPGHRVVTNKLLAPRRFDLVTYWSHSDPPLMFCQRLIGLPGEQLRFENGDLLIDDAAISVPAVIAGRCRMPPVHRTSLVHYMDGETIVLGADEYFFMGDNVDLSADSRIYGPVKRKSLVGVVDLVHWPPSKARILR